MALDLEFNEEQDMLREMVRGVCETHSGPDVVREMEDDPVGYSKEFWEQLAELGVLGLTIPEEHGGSGMSMVDAAVVYEEFGRSLAPSPHFVSSVMAGGVLLRAGSEQQQADLLPRIATGDAIVTAAWLEPGNGFGPEGVQMRAEQDGDGWTVSGTKWHVPYARAVDAILVLVRTGDANSDVDLFLVDPNAEGVSLEQQKTIASDTQFAVTFDGVRVRASDMVGAQGSGWSTWQDTMLDGAILLGAYAIGGARHALDITVQYSKDRVQFDKPLGAFQALAHYMADAVTAIDGGEILVHEAAWARSNDRPVEKLAPMAKLFACNTFRDVTAMAQQIWGGVGFTVEYDVQLYFRRAKQLQVTWWDTRHCEDLVAAAVLDADEVKPYPDL